MLGIRKRPINRVLSAEMEELERISAIPFPTCRTPNRIIVPEKQRSYDEVAQQLGFAPAELIRAQLLGFLESEGIKLYDHSQVDAWLAEKKKQAKAANWCWRALRERDVISGHHWGYNREAMRNEDGFYNSNEWSCRPYDRLVPIGALEKVAKIEAKFGDQVKFFVSDYASPNADPFIMVRPAMHNSGAVAEYNLIFDAWDEPGFGV